MDNSPTKIVVAFVLLGLFALGTLYMYFQIGLLKGTEPPPVSLQQLPKELGPWEGENRETTERMFRATQADEVLGRRYVDPAGREVVAHMAVFAQFWNEVPHSPMVCYPGSGWTTVRTDPEVLEMPDAPPLNAMFVLFEMEGRRELVMFWYQLGDRTFYDSQGLEEAQQALRDRKKWPSIIKVLLQTDASNKEQAKKRLVKFSSRVYSWSSQMQDGTTTP